MKKSIIISLITLFAFAGITFFSIASDSKEKDMNKTLYDYSALKIDSTEHSLGDYEGKVLLIVNVASKCGFTKQYAGLQELYEKYNGQGFEILGFPCNQFGGQEPGTEEEILDFCNTNFNVSFPMYAKVEVNGEHTHPVYKFLKENAEGFITDDIKWNFTKFLINKKGQVVERYAPQKEPMSIAPRIEKELAL